MTHGFGMIPIQPTSLLGEGEVEAITGDYMRALEGLGGERWAADSIPDDPAQLFLLVATGGTEEVILKVSAERRRTSPGEPLYLIAHPGNNSLPASLEVLAHCTIPRTLVESYRLRSHFESGLGVGIQGALPTGPVTLLRIGGKKMDRLWFAEGEILRSGDAENLCRTQVEIRLTNGGTVSDLLRAPLGNHLVLVYGHHLTQLRSWCKGTAPHIAIL